MSAESPRWFTSSYSNNGGQCVEVAANLVAAHDLVPVRDSKVSGSAALALPAGAFASFVADVKDGRLQRR